jgi:ketosteroid isomerase-like protein
VAKFVRAYESGDLDALVALLTDDIHVSMPPIPLEYQGRDVVARLFASIFRSGRRVDLVPTRANGQPAFGAYLRAPTLGSLAKYRSASVISLGPAIRSRRA